MDSLHFALLSIIAICVLYVYFGSSTSEEKAQDIKYLNYIEIVVPSNKLEATQIQRLIRVEAANPAVTTVKEPRNWVIRYDLGDKSFAKLELDNRASVLNGASIKFINNERAQISESHLSEPILYVFKPNRNGGGQG